MAVHGSTQMGGASHRIRAKLFPLPPQALADPLIAGTVAARWPRVAGLLGSAFVVTPTVAWVLATIPLITLAPASVIVWMLPCQLLAAVGTHGAAIMWVRERLWPPGPWFVVAFVLLAQLVLRVIEMVAAPGLGYGSGHLLWSLPVYLVAAVVAAYHTQLARGQFAAVSACRFAESHVPIRLRTQGYHVSRDFVFFRHDRDNLHTVAVTMTGDRIAVQTVDRIHRYESAHPTQTTNLFVVEFRYIADVSVHRYPPGRPAYTWIELPDGRTLEATEPTAVVVSTVLPGLGLTIPSADADLIAEIVRRRLRWAAGTPGRRRY
ncbi:hypothetical protein [Nocardia sp. NPDC058633]|uniref:hypothetical protein n=1 Tax=Nocardia sp. NPDC058633 TaxID=3346568 RepID=UPI0036474F80